MDSDASDNYEDLYEEKDSHKHDKLVDKILSLHKTQHLKKPSRTEPTLEVSEFNLVRSIAGKKGSVRIEELTKSLKDKKTRVRIGENVKKVKRHSKTLPKPLEKPQANRIRRGAAYEKARLQLDRWEGTVTANRVSNDLSFPLNDDLKMGKEESENFAGMWRIKSDLTKELEKHQPKVEEYHIGLEEEKFPLTMKEMLARRREAAKLRAFQGYQEAKARRQNKIKSKKYHRIQKREKIKKQLKEFEQLQKTNPEGALKKLEEIEKTRVEERFSLRHKSTGKWARNQQIRAKYDKESRQNLAQQLTLSRDLTQKSKTNDGSSEDEEEVEDTPVVIDESNPWVNGVKPGKEVADFVSGYRKYWLDQNKNEEKTDEEEKDPEVTEGDDKDKNMPQTQEKDNVKNVEQKVKNDKCVNGEKKKSKKKRRSKSTQNWDVSVVEDTPKKEDLTTQQNKKTPAETKEEKKKFIQEVKTLKRQLNINFPPKQDPNIDPEKYLKVKPTNLSTAIPDLVTHDLHQDQRTMISEAFEDDDIVTEFTQNKQEEIDKNKPKNVDLTLPGWGSWGGTGIKVGRRKRRRFTIKAPKKIPRRDDNKGFLILNENAQDKIKEHKVSEVPFPFKTVKDYEASVRAPIGNTFVPETAFKKLVKPPVRTKMGTIIEPMSKDFLVNKSG